ncbi:PREDICTED: galactan beta-1,4-galactosyltransferase GALS3-like [Camelina sativa]|uniref:Glycosyltransferase family 92 protein n=1 Tax=Camelina sativa TaxID=90675 RepID=A0ABM0U146_CAMSA|nr:PREDICTED: galactan beta-1,4-galactosyltransferase GALS3-like [Camelina sativa]
MAMVKEKEQNHNKDKKLLVGVIWNFSAELKLTFMALLVLFTLATLLPFLPSSFSLSTSDFRFCISRFSSALPLNTTTTATVEQSSSSSSSPTTEVKLDRILDNGVIKRTFTGYGTAAYNFVSMSAYRGGVNSFAVIGLASKPLHVYGHPSYRCEWVSSDPNQDPISTTGSKILTDWGYGRIYTTVVVNCTFSSLSAVNQQNSGGNLILHATTGDPELNLTDSIPVLTEPPNSVDFDLYNSTTAAATKKKYDYLYCGSSLYGNLSPQRVREWIAYHVRFFGERSHFVLHDAGGIHEEVFEVLKPWIELGRVTLHDIRDQERFDGYYHNQFMVVNDCLHRYRFMAKWMFFFDVDEFVYVPAKETISSVMESLEGYSQFTIEQMPMSSRICYDGDGPARTYRKWGIEKLVYRDVKKVPRRDRKYAVQPENVFATGVHMSQNLQGRTYHKAESKIRYFHYHGSISQRREPCRQLFNDSNVFFENTPYVLDTTIREVGLAVRTFELRTIGDRLLRTRQ